MRGCLVLLLAALLLPAVGAEAPAAPAVRIAVIDTGIDPTHPEFAPGQVVAWLDLTSEASPTPKDGHGHGTGTASLVAGRNVGSCGPEIVDRKISYAPGAPLIVARVGTDSGAIEGSVAAAIDWARQQGASVISVSIGVSIPFPSGIEPAIARAQAAGILVVVSAGNGVLNTGVTPYPSWTSSYRQNRDALVVGGASPYDQARTSTTGNSDPDVIAWSDRVCAAVANTGGYRHMTGTSFSTPLVAGMAGALAQTARDAGQPHDGARLRALLQAGATNDPLMPYHREGLGALGAAQFGALVPHAREGTLPDYAAQGPHAQIDLAYHQALRTYVRR